MERVSVNYAFVRRSLRLGERVLIIRSPRALPAIKCESETSSTLSSYIFFSPRRIKGGVNW